MIKIEKLGFIGLGVMGEPMGAHLVEKSGIPVTVFDLAAEPVERLVGKGAISAQSVAEVARASDVLFISLPSGRHLEKLCRDSAGILSEMSPQKTVVDLGTSPPKLSRELARDFEAKGVEYADAPVARTRQAAEEGRLAITVGAKENVYQRILPLLSCFGTEITHCGEVGTGQLVKIMNNMMVVSTVTALCEAVGIAQANGMSVDLMFDAFSKGSADSFALRNHGLKAVAPRKFPKRVFSTAYMHKDMTYALEMAKDAGVSADGIARVEQLLQRAIDAGHKDEYWPVIVDLIVPSKG